MAKLKSNFIKRTKKPKIALLVNAFWNSGAGISGGDQRAMQIFSRLEKKFEIDIYTSAEGKKVFGKEIKSASYIVSSKGIEKGNVLLRYQRRSNWLTGKLIGKRYSIIYSSSDFFPDVTPAYIYKKNNPEVLWTSCVFHIYPNWRKRPGNKFINLIGTSIQRESFKKIRALADKVVNINYQVRDELVKKYKFDKNKIIVNPCGIDIKYFENTEAKKRPLQVCFIARLVPSKGIFDLADIWSGVAEKFPAAKLKIIGGGSDEVKQKLKNSFEQSGLLKNVEILGFLENDKAYKILKESVLFIFPSHEEGFGIAIAEAFACGVPAIAWDLPVYKEVFPDGLVGVKIGDKPLFAKNIVELLGDKKKLSKLASGVLGMVQRYNWDAIAQVEMSFLENKIN